VADDVVHLAGDAGAFGEGRQLYALLAFHLQPMSPVGQRTELCRRARTTRARVAAATEVAQRKNRLYSGCCSKGFTR
jgi:hypothetical protein